MDHQDFGTAESCQASDNGNVIFFLLVFLPLFFFLLYTFLALCPMMPMKQETDSLNNRP